MSGSHPCAFLFKQLPLCFAIAYACRNLQRLFPSKDKKNQAIKHDLVYKPVYALLGDVGGTNIRLQLVLIQPPNDLPIEFVKKGRQMVRQHQKLEDCIRHFLKDVPINKYPEIATIGIAGPVQNNQVFMSNVLKWGKLKGEQLSKNLGIRDFVFLNDFTANSFGLLLMKEDNFVSLNGLNMQPQKTRGVLGPGTGLGNSLIYTAPFRNRQRIYVLPSEGGHTDFSYIDNESVQFFKFYTERSGYNYISLERSFCGPAIPYMYQFFASKHPHYHNADQVRTSQEILLRYLANPEGDTLEKMAVDFFIKLYCNAISNFIVTHMCTGGLYLVGSLTNALIEKLKSIDITAGYKQRHPQLSQTIDKVPIVFSKELDLGLKGAYVYARRIIADQQHN